VTTLVLLLAVCALALMVGSYVIYPSVIFRLAARRPVELAPAPPLLSTEVLVSAADEEGVIGGRVRDLLAQEAPGLSRISIGCDGCQDGTAQEASSAAQGFSGRVEVRVVEFAERRGKAAVLNDLVSASAADVIVFTDANTRFEPGAVWHLVEALGDGEVGAACGRLLLESGEGQGGSPEREFWDRETRLKQAEGRLGVCLGANGAIYAARREWIVPLPSGTSMDDFLIPVSIARQGKRVVFAGAAVAREAAARDAAAEVSRRFRIGVGAGQVLRRETWLWNPFRYGLLSFAFLGRKAARWLAPVFALAAALAALFSPRLIALGAAALGVAFLLLLFALARPRLGGVLGRLYYFAVINLALALGVTAGLFGYRRPAWKRRTR
jgi:cellulose synthase/poly-beta-1,6-N-acetylglucosamine synthase-like glycosyltransferase